MPARVPGDHRMTLPGSHRSNAASTRWAGSPAVGRSWVVAVSGGGDSVGLVEGLARGRAEGRADALGRAPRPRRAGRGVAGRRGVRRRTGPVARAPVRPRPLGGDPPRPLRGRRPPRPIRLARRGRPRPGGERRGRRPHAATTRPRPSSTGSSAGRGSAASPASPRGDRWAGRDAGPAAPERLAPGGPRLPRRPGPALPRRRQQRRHRPHPRPAPPRPFAPARRRVQPARSPTPWCGSPAWPAASERSLRERILELERAATWGVASHDEVDLDPRPTHGRAPASSAPRCSGSPGARGLARGRHERRAAGVGLRTWSADPRGPVRRRRRDRGVHRRPAPGALHAPAFVGPRQSPPVQPGRARRPAPGNPRLGPLARRPGRAHRSTPATRATRRSTSTACSRPFSSAPPCPATASTRSAWATARRRSTTSSAAVGSAVPTRPNPPGLRPARHRLGRRPPDLTPRPPHRGHDPPRRAPMGRIEPVRRVRERSRSCAARARCHQRHRRAGDGPQSGEGEQPSRHPLARRRSGGRNHPDALRTRQGFVTGGRAGGVGEDAVVDPLGGGDHEPGVEALGRGDDEPGVGRPGEDRGLRERGGPGPVPCRGRGRGRGKPERRGGGAPAPGGERRHRQAAQSHHGHQLVQRRGGNSQRRAAGAFSVRSESIVVVSWRGGNRGAHDAPRVSSRPRRGPVYASTPRGSRGIRTSLPVTGVQRVHGRGE